jgi:hypothetical protein
MRDTQPPQSSRFIVTTVYTKIKPFQLELVLLLTLDLFVISRLGPRLTFAVGFRSSA